MDPQQQQIQQLIHQFAGLYFGFLAFAYIVKVALYVIPYWRIATKSGKPGAIALLCAIPLVGRLIAAYVLAFSEWSVVPGNSPYTSMTPPYGYPPAVPPSHPPANYPPQGPIA